MEEIWQRACTHYDVPEDVANSWFERIRQRLSESEPARSYHNWNEMMMHKQKHLEHCKPHIALAAFFQYYTYDGNRNCAKGNCSAFEEFCYDAQLDDEETKNLILKLLGDKKSGVSDELSNKNYENEANFLQDLDLVVLGSSPDVYQKYKNLLRQEYESMSEENYKSMRLKNKQDDERPGTSKGGPAKVEEKSDESTFKKFVDELKRRRGFNYMTSSTLSTENVRKMKKTPKTSRRQERRLMKSLLNESKEEKTEQKPSDNLKSPATSGALKMNSQLNKSREEGEISTEEEADTSVQIIDDDCILVEDLTIEKIVIDDDEDEPGEEGEDDDVTLIPPEATEEKKLFFEDKTGSQILNCTPLVEEPSCTAVLNSGIIILDETNDMSTSVKNETEKKFSESSAMDDSVLFVSETIADFIPLVSDNVKKRFLPTPITPLVNRKQHFDTSLFSKSEKKQLEAYNNNSYNPNAIVEKEQRRQDPKRLVIVDGSNVAFSHNRNNEFSVKGLKICIEYFEKMGHKVKAVVPQFRLGRFKSTDPEGLDQLHRKGIVVLTPCKNLPGKATSSYDDRFILQLASELDAAIVSNDNYRDLINENSAFKKLIENRVIGYTWCDDVFMLPKDPYGKFGPTLHSILNRPAVQ